MPRAGAFLVVEDRFTHADVALVLSGLPVSRAFAARDLYRQGRVEEIWVIPEPAEKIEGEVVSDRVMRELLRLGLLDPGFPQWSTRILAATGVPRARIVVLPEPANGTIVEACRIRALLRSHPPRSMVLITSRSASRRARMIFRHVLGHSDVQIFSYPTPYDTFQADRWWTQPRNALTVVTEYQKLLANALALTFRREES